MTKEIIYSKKFPENKPNVSGYYMANHIENGKVYRKAIYWVKKDSNWFGWRGIAHSPIVISFWEEVVDDYYVPCLDKANNYELKHNDWENIIAPHQDLLTV